MKIRPTVSAPLLIALTPALSLATPMPSNAGELTSESLSEVLGTTSEAHAYQPFRRLASFPVFLNTDVDDETVAEIVAASEDGQTLVYTDSEGENLGFVDISDPSQPQPLGTVDLPGEPTSVAVRGGYALVCVNSSADFVQTSGDLIVIELATGQVVRTLPLGGQPDSIAVSPDGAYAAVCIENERDEDLGDGEPPQAPAGFLVIVDLVGAPAAWTTRAVSLVGVPDLFPEDPEPEYVDINTFNIAAVSMQENNHCALVRLSDGEVVHDFSFGSANLTRIDTEENDLIEQNSSLDDVPREPDALKWISPFTLATADEGDLFGGSRGFTTWTLWGQTLFRAGNDLEHLAASIGHYPEGRSENKGVEPEGVTFGRYGFQNYLFVGCERSNFVAVYQLFSTGILGSSFPALVQVLPTGVGPEGLLAIPQRDLFVVASEVDDRGDKIRSTIMIYGRDGGIDYPDIVSRNRPNGSPIPWAALSGLAKPGFGSRILAVHDSFYRKSRVYTLRDRGASAPAQILRETPLVDSGHHLADALADLKASLPGTDDFDPADLIEADGTVNLDLEGIEAGPFGRTWVVSEGAGNLVDGVSDPDDRPFESPNLIARLGRHGDIEQVLLPPLEVTRNQLRFGFEGVAHMGPYLYVAFQRAWQAAGDPSHLVRIARVNLHTHEWTFAHYPLDEATSPAGGWVGLSELTALGGGELAVIERDNQGGPDAAVKRIYRFSIHGVTFRAADEVASFDVIDKQPVIDLIATDAYGPAAGLVPEKLEGLTITSGGTALIVNDNDGVDDNSGETRLLRLPGLFH